MHATEIEAALMVNDIEHFVKTADTIPSTLGKVLEHLKLKYSFMQRMKSPAARAGVRLGGHQVRREGAVAR